MRGIFALDVNGQPRAALRDGDGMIRAILGYATITSETTRGQRRDEERPPSSLLLFDKNGEVIWKAP